jgi:hypothetical protein
LQRSCDAPSASNWKCRWDNVVSNWTWDDRKEEFTGIIELRADWEMRATFKNLTGPVFKRATLEIIRKTGQTSVTELRQEFFFR